MAAQEAAMATAEDARFEEFGAEASEPRRAGAPVNTMQRLGDVYLPVSIELGRTKMRIAEILEMDKGTIIEFNKLAGETVDLLVNDRKFAEGEVVVIDEHFGIRITALIRTAQVELENR